MKKKLQLKDLKVKSFQTQLTGDKRKTVVGGMGFDAIDTSCGLPDCQCE
ncbi:MAG: pinensin family lanthipeptide [Acidobacteriota bacterium]|nr:pinensin family lanthipeptide [Acidobacteriota bacterium]